MTGEPPVNRYHGAFHDEHGDWCQPNCPFDYATQLAGAEAELLAMTRERDLAVAHDRQPYPTAWAYERATEALHRAEAELLALRPVVEAAVAWAIPWKEPEEAMAANGALVDAVAHYQRGPSGRAASDDDDLMEPMSEDVWKGKERCRHCGSLITLEDGVWVDGSMQFRAECNVSLNHEPGRADAARASREPSE